MFVIQTVWQIDIEEFVLYGVDVADEAKHALYQAVGRLVHQHRNGKTTDPMTQDRLGVLVGLSRTSITNIEKGRQHVSLHQLYRIADALNIPVEALLPPPSRPGRSELAQKLPPGIEPEISKWADSLTVR